MFSVTRVTSGHGKRHSGLEQEVTKRTRPLICAVPLKSQPTKWCGCTCFKCSGLWRRLQEVQTTIYFLSTTCSFLYFDNTKQLGQFAPTPLCLTAHPVCICFSQGMPLSCPNMTPSPSQTLHMQLCGFNSKKHSAGWQCSVMLQETGLSVSC